MPEFTATLSDVETSEGKTAYFECQISALPTPEIRFYKGSKELYDSNKFRISQEGDKFILAIYNVTLDDQDEYSVKAKNKGGSRISRANLTVKCAPKIKLPERYKTTVMFEKDEQVVIKIPFVANPKPAAQWFKGTEEIKSNDAYQVEVSNHYVTLKITKSNSQLSGVYKLNLANSLGSDSCEVKIQITDVPEPPRFLVVENVKDESVTLSWKPPASDGGSLIMNYIVEKLELSATVTLAGGEKPAENWTRCSITRLNHFTDETLLPLHKYQFRVIAQNLQGRSKPCEPTSVITTLGKKFYYFYIFFNLYAPRLLKCRKKKLSKKNLNLFLNV